jgi:hypothetical protein
MTLAAFRQLPPRRQLLFVMHNGTYLAHRRDEDACLTNLYFVPNGEHGFFTEIGFDDRQACLIVLRSLSSSVLLEEYAQGVILPED